MWCVREVLIARDRLSRFAASIRRMRGVGNKQTVCAAPLIFSQSLTYGVKTCAYVLIDIDLVPNRHPGVFFSAVGNQRCTGWSQECVYAGASEKGINIASNTFGPVLVGSTCCLGVRLLKKSRTTEGRRFINTSSGHLFDSKWC